ncbi:alpha/beta fold hydrolase [Leptospira gomenensis]|uniref:Alpha/beta fold hydrolase n=1 Tax=Leptospira gomenensis TaxID=2484974 RepID=A0A5F1YAT2_9LEPT|nr:alpha/beta fold hydrolase [Leptospira gomenensis]TGK33419.1 alpha/beta fold hydrolase [Leptospira gomenensis]TGK40941.1 alpha/beta fold hydrolase [Leptospira gomenensis]TGK46389.1 alpha/beta fold hydrolase [Leptospira gomenensis]TGK67475.1 alpha/beta fold hydrolase [Leptospira gomenensis]
MKVEKNKFFVRSGDSYSLSVHSFLSNDPKIENPLILFPAMGIPGKFYVKVALQLAQAGFRVYVADLRGSGDSGPAPSRKNDFGYSDLIYKDWPAIVSSVCQRHPEAKPILIGHSLGGQLSSIYSGLHPNETKGLILVATGTPFFKHFPFPYFALYLFFYFFSRFVSFFFGYFPGDRLKVMGRNARQVMKDWSKVGITGSFRDSEGVSLEYTFEKIECPVLCISFSDDTYAPKSPVDAILKRIGSSDITRLHVDPSREGYGPIGHLGWLKNSDIVSGKIGSWILEKIK